MLCWRRDERTDDEDRAATCRARAIVTAIADATGVVCDLSTPPRRIVSLIPSITEILFALGKGDAVAGVTIFCTQPPEGVATKTRIGGEKDPKLDAIRALGADLVIANVEENVRAHVETLREWGIPVFVTYPRTVAAGIRLVEELGRLIGAEDTGRRIASDLDRRLDRLRARRAGRAPARVFCPIWRRPYMTINGDTFIDDMLRECGGRNVFAAAATRYPEVTLDEAAAASPDVIVLPDEPYRFRHAHVADFDAYPSMPAVRDARIHLIGGKLLSWYGPRIAEALAVLPGLLDPGLPSDAD